MNTLVAPRIDQLHFEKEFLWHYKKLVVHRLIS